MKHTIYFLILAVAGCASNFKITENGNYAYIATTPFEQTSDCTGSALIIVGVKQPGRVAVDMDMNSIWVPEGKNYIYYNRIDEFLDRGKCIVLREYLVRHTELPISRLKQMPSGVELEIDVNGGSRYSLEIIGNSAQLVKVGP